MSKTIKNIPKKTKEVLNDLIEPYIGPKPVIDDSNRGNDISAKNDTFKDISIGFEDITEAVFYYFNNVIKPSVIENNNRIKVPVLYADQERWKSVQQDGFIRDKEGRVMYPVILIKRENIEKRRDLGNKLDGNKSNLYQTYEKSFSRKNQYDNFSVLTNRIPVKEFRTIVVPDYYNITYTCIVYVNYMTDLDNLLSSIGFASDSYWGDREKFQFMCRIDSMPTTQQISQGEDRIISSTFNITLTGHIIPNTVNKELATKNKFLSKAQVIFNTEFISGGVTNNNMREINASGGSIKVNYNNYINTSTIVNYLGLNKEKTASIINSNSAIFNSSFSIAPNPLPATSLENFVFFVNGVYLEKSAIISFIDNNNGTCTLTIDPNELSYILESTDEIIAIGKFE